MHRIEVPSNHPMIRFVRYMGINGRRWEPRHTCDLNWGFLEAVVALVLASLLVWVIFLLLGYVDIRFILILVGKNPARYGYGDASAGLYIFAIMIHALILVISGIWVAVKVRERIGYRAPAPAKEPKPPSVVRQTLSAWYDKVCVPVDVVPPRENRGR